MTTNAVAMRIYPFGDQYLWSCVECEGGRTVRDAEGGELCSAPSEGDDLHEENEEDAEH